MYIILFLTGHNEFINDNKNDDLHTSTACLTRLIYILLMTSQSIAVDVTMTRQLWRDNSLDIMLLMAIFTAGRVRNSFSSLFILQISCSCYQKVDSSAAHPFPPTVYPKKYAHGFCFAVLCCGYTLTDFPISIRLTSLALWQSNDCPSASKATLMNMDKYFMWIHYERLHNQNKTKHNITVCICLGIYCRGVVILSDIG